MTLSEKVLPNTFYAIGKIEQQGKDGFTEFDCCADLSADPSDNSKENRDQEAINYLIDLIERGDHESILYNEDGDEVEDENGDEVIVEEVNLFGFTVEEFAKKLVLNEKECAEKYGTTWEIKTNFDPVPENSDEYENFLSF